MLFRSRREARDIFDILFILKYQEKSLGVLHTLILEYGLPENEEGLEGLITDPSYLNEYKEVIRDASPKTGH